MLKSVRASEGHRTAREGRREGGRQTAKSGTRLACVPDCNAWRRVFRAAPYATRVTMGIDPTASSVTLLDPDTGKGRITYLCEGQPERLFQPTPGLWFSNQSDEVRC